MLSFTRAQGALLAPGEHVSALRDLVGELLTHQQTLRDVVDRLLGLDIRYDLDGVAAHPLVGGWAPDLRLRTDRGDTRLATHMHGAWPALLDLTPDGWPRAAAAGWADPVQTTVARSDEPLEGILAPGRVCGLGRRCRRPRPRRTPPSAADLVRRGGMSTRGGSLLDVGAGGVTPNPVRIAIVGAGRIGGNAARLWSRADHDVLI